MKNQIRKIFEQEPEKLKSLRLETQRLIAELDIIDLKISYSLLKLTLTLCWKYCVSFRTTWQKVKQLHQNIKSIVQNYPEEETQKRIAKALADNWWRELFMD